MSQIERKAAQELFRLSTDEAHQTECFVIGADEDVLAVIQCLAVDGDTARSATEMPGRSEQVTRAPAAHSSTAVASPAQPPPMTAMLRGTVIGSPRST